MSNWTLAALLAGTGAATVALAHHSFAASVPTAGPAAAGAAAQPAAGAAAGAGAGGPQVSHSVATTSGSGATMTTTTRTVHGRTVIIRTVHPAVYHDN